MSVDGGKIRLRTPLGQISQWQDYKAINLHDQCVSAFFQENSNLVDWANQQPLSCPVICLGDGHDGIWNIFAQIGDEAQRCEILDWYHLVENLAKTGDPQLRLDAAEAYRASIDAYQDEHDDTYAHVAQGVGHDLCAAIAAYKAKDFDGSLIRE